MPPAQTAPPRPEIRRYRRPGRPAVEPALVHVAADQLLERGERPTVEAVRRTTGGSPNTLAPILDQWWKDLSGRVHAAKRSRKDLETAFDRLPGELALIAEAFFQEALAQARVRERAERSKEIEASEEARKTLAVRGQVWAMREREWRNRLKLYEERIEELEREACERAVDNATLRTLKVSLESRVLELRREVMRLTVKLQRRARPPKRPARSPRRAKSRAKIKAKRRKPAHKATRRRRTR